MDIDNGPGGDGPADVQRKPTSGVILAAVGLQQICDMVSFSELKRLRQVCRAFHAVVGQHPRFQDCSAWLEHDWIEESRGMNFEKCPKFKGYRFRYFPFKRNTLFPKFWTTCGTNVTRIHFKHVKMQCDWMVNFLQGCPHLEDVTFKLCIFKMEVCGKKTLLNKKEVDAKTCCTHVNGLEDLKIAAEAKIAPKIHTLVLKHQDVIPLCLLDLLLERADGTIVNFTYMDATWPDWRRNLHYPSKKEMQDRFAPFLVKNQGRIQSFTWLRNHRGDLFLEELEKKHRFRINPIELVIGQKSSWNHTPTAATFLRFINNCVGNNVEKLYLRFIHRVDTVRAEECIFQKTNLKHLTLDFIWPKNGREVNIRRLLALWPNLESLELWDRNRKRESTMTHDYIPNVPQTLKKFQFFHYYQPIANVAAFINDPTGLSRTITELHIESGKFFTNAMMQTIITDLTQLEILSISNSTLLTDAGLTGLNDRAVKIITQCKSPIINTHAINPLMTVGRNIKELKKLRKLSFCMSRKISDISIALGFEFPEIREINLSWCLNVTDGGLYNLLMKNPSLERIILMKNRKITHYGLNELVANFPTLKNIHTSRSCRDRRMGKQLNYVEHPRFKRVVSYSKWSEKRPCVFGDA